MSKERPADFNKRFDIVGCFLEHDNKFLLLRRQPNKANGDAWGLPAGKKEDDESMEQAVLREVEEETGIKLTASDIKYFDSLYVRNGDFDIEWHMFSTQLDSQPVVTCNTHEHSEFCWVSS
ncbi:MAG: NUDIX hydrolase, partial [Patescibacteria group bacterium]